MKYTFKIQTGNDTDNQAEYHPVYITDDSIGGYKQRSAADKTVSNKYFCSAIGCTKYWWIQGRH